MKDIYFSTRAKKRLEKLLEYLETEWSLNVKQSFVEKLDQAILQVRKMPESCQTSQKKRGVYKCFVTKHTCFFYRVKAQRIEVIAFFDNRQNPSKSEF